MNFAALALLVYVGPAQPEEPAPPPPTEESAPASEPGATADPAATEEAPPATEEPPPATPAAEDPTPKPMPPPEPMPAAEPEPKRWPKPAPAPMAKPAPAPAPVARGPGPLVSVGLQIRPRIEKAFLGNLGVPATPGALKGGSNYMTTQRTRATLKFDGGNAAAKLSIQDVRTWGSETDTLKDFSADKVDFHEAWLQVGDTYRLRVGRQEIALDGHRLIGTVDWAQQARTFDAFRFDYDGDGRDLTLIATRVMDGQPHDIFMVNVVFDLAGIRASVPLIFQTNEIIARGERTGDSKDEWNRFTGGVHIKAGGKLFWRVEGYAQAGTDHNAFMAAASVGYKVSDMIKPVLWVDYLSGDTDHNDLESAAFDTLFATNHKFYGNMDRFINVPAATNNGGLIDIAVKNKGKIGPGTLEVAVHQFILAQKDSAGNEGLIGLETDVIYAVPLHDKVKLIVGAAGFLDQGDFKKARDLATLRPSACDDNTLECTGARTFHDWFFLMLDINL